MRQLDAPGWLVQKKQHVHSCLMPTLLHVPSSVCPTHELLLLVANGTMPGRQEATETSKFMADAIGSGVPHSAESGVAAYMASLRCLVVATHPV